MGLCIFGILKSMLNNIRLDIPQILNSVTKNLKLLMSNPRKGIKAASIFFYLVAGTVMLAFVYFKLEWTPYNPFIVLLALFIAIVLFLAVNYLLMRIFIKFDKSYR